MKMIKPNVEMVNPEAFHAVRKLQEDPMNMTFYEEHAGCNWQSVLIKTILEYLTPQNIRIYVLAKAYESIANETERWYGTKYKKEKVSKETMNMWNLAMDLKLPSKNNFIPTTFHYKLQTAFVIIVIVIIIIVIINYSYQLIIVIIFHNIIYLNTNFPITLDDIKQNLYNS